ncbi:hypothetical protein G5V59_19265 [Nocardioides sp. W3-2-3]|uniref:hypothetical protein n=1 Tax=Nocardioides convexus TaxID=2712224 RepID=UPI0024184A24|nr:hypothetical protein [Nocardioides convexus]NHA01269.1 hypothetical protein [Nocardioides convexus]
MVVCALLTPALGLVAFLAAAGLLVALALGRFEPQAIAALTGSRPATAAEPQAMGPVLAEPGRPRGRRGRPVRTPASDSEHPGGCGDRGWRCRGQPRPGRRHVPGRGDRCGGGRRDGSCRRPTACDPPAARDRGACGDDAVAAGGRGVPRRGPGVRLAPVHAAGVDAARCRRGDLHRAVGRRGPGRSGDPGRRGDPPDLPGAGGQPPDRGQRGGRGRPAWWSPWAWAPCWLACSGVMAIR